MHLKNVCSFKMLGGILSTNGVIGVNQGCINSEWKKNKQ